MTPPLRRESPAPFSVLGALAPLVTALIACFHEAWSRGWVLSQADILLQYLPWSAARPAGFVQPGNALLSDVPFQFYPFTHEAVAAIRQGLLPLWHSGAYAGFPLFAAAQTAVLSPFTALAYVLPLPEATVAVAAAKLLTGGAGMVVLVRRLGLGWPAATVAGLGYGLNPFSVVWLEHNHSGASSWLPWVLWATVGVISRGTPRDGALLAVFVCLTLLAGHPEIASKVLLFGLGYAVSCWFSQRFAWRTVRYLVIGAGAGLVLASIQILPFLEYVGESRLHESRRQAVLNVSVVPRRTVVTALVPDFFGHPARRSATVSTRYGNATNYAEQQAYAGVVTWVLAAIGVFCGWRRHHAVRYATLAAVFGALLMYGAPGVVPIVSALPVLKLTVLSRFGLLPIASASVLAAFGVERLLDTTLDGASPAERRRLRRVLVLVPLTIAAIVAAFLVRERRLLLDALIWSDTLRASGVTVGVATLVAGAGLASGGRRLARPVVLSVVLALLGGELVVFARAFHPLIPQAFVYPNVPELERLGALPHPFRVAGWGDTLMPNGAMMYRLQQMRGYDGMGPRRYAALLDAAFGSEATLHVPGPFRDSPVFDLLNVEYVLTRPDATPPAPHYSRVAEADVPLFRNERVLPRAFLVQDLRVVDREDAAELVASGGIDLRRVAVLEAELPAGLRPEPGGAGVGTARISRYSHLEVEVITEAPGRRLLMLGDAYFPGWLATVDGEPVDIVPADAALRAVPVPAGVHRVLFRYAPRSFRFGVYLTLLTAAALVVWSVDFGSRRQRRPAHP